MSKVRTQYPGTARNVRVLEPSARRVRPQLVYDGEAVPWPLTVDHLPHDVHGVGMSLARAWRECA